MQAEQFLPFLIAMLLGALLGFERSFAFRAEDGGRTNGKEMMGGVRTFSLIALIGCTASLLEEWHGGILLAAFIGVLLLVVISYYISYNKRDEVGITTEVSIILAFIIGVTVHRGSYVLAAFITVLVMMILHLKRYVNAVTERIKFEDISAIVKFGIITFVVLPVFDPHYALTVRDLGIEALDSEIRIINPYNVWLMVVLISGIGFAGYAAVKTMGARKGIGLTGLLGGVVSSTATTLTFSKRSRLEESHSLSFALAVLLACTVMFPRILLEVFIVNSALVPTLSVTMSLMALAGCGFCFILWRKTGREKSEEIPLHNPFEIIPAVKFGLLYAVIVFITQAAGEIAGETGVYLVSVISGFTDVDAITLTMSQVAREDPSRTGQATVAITIAAFSNTLMKLAMALYLGSRKLRVTVALGFALIILFGMAGLALLSFL